LGVAGNFEPFEMPIEDIAWDKAGETRGREMCEATGGREGGLQVGGGSKLFGQKIIAGEKQMEKGRYGTIGHQKQLPWQSWLVLNKHWGWPPPRTMEARDSRNAGKQTLRYKDYN